MRKLKLYIKAFNRYIFTTKVKVYTTIAGIIFGLCYYLSRDFTLSALLSVLVVLVILLDFFTEFDKKVGDLYSDPEYFWYSGNVFNDKRK